MFVARRLGPALLALSLLGCSGADRPRSQPSREGGKSERIEDLVDLGSSGPARPLTTEEQYVIQASWDRLISACMAKAGLRWEVVTSRNLPSEANPYPTKSELLRSGYAADFAAMHLSDRDANERFLNDPINSVPPADQAAYQRAFSGTKTLTVRDGEGTATISTDGCVAEANAQIYGSVENALWLSQVVEVGTPSQLNRALMDYPDYVQALRKWQDCMRSAGVSWMDGEGAGPNWDTGYEVLRFQMVTDDTVPTKQEETKIASDDAECGTSSDLFDVRSEHLPDVKAKVWKKAGFEQSDKWRLQQASLARAKLVR